MNTTTPKETRMSNSSSSSSSSGIGFAGLLTIAFIVLKLTHFIDWSWWWILSPLWISAGIAVAVIAVVLAVAFAKPRKPKSTRR